MDRKSSKIGSTVGRAGGLAVGFLDAGAAVLSSSSATGLDGGGFFFVGPVAAGAEGGAALGGGAPMPVLHLTVAFSNASLIFAFRTSAKGSITAFKGLSPTIFMRVPRHVAASFLAPSEESSRSVVKLSASGLI